jgi:hypothetical protein
VQATAGHGIKPDIRLRLWFWLSRCTAGDELARWINDAVDPASFRPVQIIYTAAPIFDGIQDPLPRRLVKLPGDDAVAVPPAAELAPPEPPPRLPPPKPSIRGDRYVDAALADAIRTIAHAPNGTRHNALMTEGASLLRFVPDRLSPGDFVEVLAGAARAAGLDQSEADDEISWLLAKVGAE